MVYVFLAEGFEEIEALTPVDVLRRAGVSVATVGITGKTVISSHKVPVVADIEIEQVNLEQAKMLILPGGMPGTKNLYASDFVREAVTHFVQERKYIGAICAAPSIILGGMGILQGKNATCYPGMEAGMEGANAQAVSCVQDGNVITGRGAGAAFDFACKLCEVLCGAEKAQEVAQSICYGQ